MTRAALAAATAVAIVLLAVGVRTHLAASCAAREVTPVSCPPAPPPGSREDLAALRSRIAASPGDSWAHAALTRVPPDLGGAGLLRAATLLAPNEPNVVMARANAALARRDWAQAVPPLVQLANHYRADTADPVVLLARIAASGHADLVRPFVDRRSQWFPVLVDEAVRLQLPLEALMPLVGHASMTGAMPLQRLRAFVRTLKHRGRWGDAFGLWLAQHEGRVPVLYNASFDQAFEPDGFDWEAPAAGPGRPGAVVATRPFPGRRQVLEVVFTGHAFPTPIVRQYLLLPPGSYRLQGQFMATRLRSDEGLAWSVRCVSAAQAMPAARSPAFRETEGSWEPFEFAFDIEPACPVASLELEPAAAFEATAGLRGTAYFDAFSLHKSTR